MEKNMKNSWKPSNDETKLLADIIDNSCRLKLEMSKEEIEIILPAYVELKRKIKKDYEEKNGSIFSSCADKGKKASLYYQHINLATLNRLWQASFSAYHMDKIINRQEHEKWEAQMIGYYFLSFCISTYAAIGLLYEEKRLLDKKDEDIWIEIPPLSNKKVKDFFLQQIGVDPNSLYDDLIWYRNNVAHHFPPGSGLFQKKNGSWIILHPSENNNNNNNKIRRIQYFEDFIDAEIEKKGGEGWREAWCRDSENHKKYIELTEWYPKVLKWTLKCITKAWENAIH